VDRAGMAEIRKVITHADATEATALVRRAMNI
jgi:hypothetical protein